MLDVQDLRIEIGPNCPVERVSFSIAKGRALALVGRSGSGKSLTALALMGLLPRSVTRIAGRALLEGEGDLLSMPRRKRRPLRGKRIAIVFQEPGAALNPIQRIGGQIEEAVRAHDRISKSEARARAKDALARMRFPDPEHALFLYPYQLSGGMRQRALIAMASVHRPSVLIADEATSALDRSVAEEIVDLFASLKADGTSILFITHDLSLAARFCEDTAVMLDGQIVERGPTSDVFSRPSDPYTRALVEASS
jgi:peptide/nickel transport system ATP-binding protein